MEFWPEGTKGLWAVGWGQIGRFSSNRSLGHSGTEIPESGNRRGLSGLLVSWIPKRESWDLQDCWIFGNSNWNAFWLRIVEKGRLGYTCMPSSMVSLSTETTRSFAFLFLGFRGFRSFSILIIGFFPNCPCVLHVAPWLLHWWRGLWKILCNLHGLHQFMHPSVCNLAKFDSKIFIRLHWIR